MRSLVYYSLMLLVGFVWYRLGQHMLRKGYRDENDQRTEGFVGPFGFIFTAGLSCYFVFALLRALIRAEVPCLGRGCNVHVYTLAAHASDYWANMFYLLWLVLALVYALYVTGKIWFRV